METILIKYFLAVAKYQSIKVASEELGITPSALSKAITRLENELEVHLFEKSGRNIQITNDGKKLIQYGNEFLSVEKSILREFHTGPTQDKIKFAGSEFPLSYFGPRLITRIEKKFPGVHFEFLKVSNEEALELVKSFQVDLSFYASVKPIRSNDAKLIDKVPFKVFVSKAHPLYKTRKSIPVKEIIKQRFAMTNYPAVELLSNAMSLDGWREDKFKRENVIYSDSLKCLDNLLQQGLVISYLPEVYGQELGLRSLSISDCPYKCELYIYLYCHKYGLNNIWRSL